MDDEEFNKELVGLKEQLNYVEQFLCKYEEYQIQGWKIQGWNVNKKFKWPID